MALTRRRFMLESAELAGGILASRLATGLPAALADTPTAPPRAAGAPPDLPPPSLHNDDYWSVADWIAPFFDQLWDPDARYYRSGRSRNGRIYHNSALLTTHAIAALAGHRGPSRQDDRARLLARRFCESPPWSEETAPIEPDPQFHNPGWVESFTTLDAPMDKSIDPKVAEALMYAWRARDALRLPQSTVDLIKDRITRCARGDFYRFPNVRLNQINWHSEMYAHLATVTGDTELLRDDYRRQMERFCAGITRALVPGGSPNLGPGYRFHYLPHKPPNHPLNLDSAEYANMTCHFLIWYEGALRAGMAPLAEGDVRRLRAWVEHIVCGYWTHAGYLNWDTGWSFKRWHAGRTFALARQGLLAIVLSPRFQAHPEIGGWAKWVFDAGFALYERLSREAPDGAGIAPAVLYDLHVNELGPSIRELFAARIQADAARAVALGLGGIQALQPPPLYSFDADIGRLAVTTPTYSTALLPIGQNAIPYGGIELARFFDAKQRVAANIAGRPWASFGVVIRNLSGRAVLQTQRPRRSPSSARPPLELVASPRGAVRRATPYSPRPDAGPFERLVARGRLESREAVVETTQRFRKRSIETRWRIVRRKRARYTVDVLFPTWGRDASVTAVLRDGRAIVLAAPLARKRRIRLREVAYFYLAGAESGYVVVPIGGRRGRAYTIRPEAQAAVPDPGPTLRLQLVHRDRFKRLTLAARIAPATSPEHAARVAARLRRG